MLAYVRVHIWFSYLIDFKNINQNQNLIYIILPNYLQSVGI